VLKIGLSPLMMREIKSSSSTNLPTAASWSPQVFAVNRYSVQFLDRCCRVCNCLFKWVIRERDFEADLFANTSHTCLEVFKPKTVERTLLDNVILIQLSKYLSFLVQIENSRLVVYLPRSSDMNCCGHGSELSIIPNSLWLFKIGTIRDSYLR
jgi:hypothetical protein